MIKPLAKVVLEAIVYRSSVPLTAPRRVYPARIERVRNLSQRSCDIGCMVVGGLPPMTNCMNTPWPGGAELRVSDDKCVVLGSG
jgi:hypothetical protein